MRRALLAVALVVAFLPPATAHAAIAGLTCGMDTSDDPTGVLANPDTQVGFVTAGPVLAASLPFVDDNTALDLATIAIHCSVRINGTGFANDFDSTVVSVSSPTATSGYLPPTQVQYPDADAIWLCTNWTITDTSGTVTLYADSQTGLLTTDPTQALCYLAVETSQDLCDFDTSPSLRCLVPVGTSRRDPDKKKNETAQPQPVVCVDGADAGATCVYQ